MLSKIAVLSLAAAVRAQKAGTLEPETHPRMSWKQCSGPGSCSNVDGQVVIDANWRWTHVNGQNCYDGNEWTSQCSSDTDCAQNCAVEGAKYTETYGASTSGDALTLKFVTEHAYGTNIGSRLYLMADESSYQMFDLVGNEFTFDVDLSAVECGLNSALYFVAMPEDGGVSSQAANTAGAKFGTGYCDAQCARDLKFLGGEANFEGWAPSPDDDNAGVGRKGSCCAEIDVWESNAYAYALTPHACENNEYHICETDNCGGTYSEDRFAGLCDANGCDYNPYRMGNTDFYGAGMTVDTSKKFTVVTQFEHDRINQFFVQDGVTIEVPGPKIDGIPGDDGAITPELCAASAEVFGERNRFEEIGGYETLNAALDLPMVLVMSIWADHYANMLWLDGVYPPEREGEPGVARGPCAADSGEPDDVIANFPDAQVIWSNIRFGR